MNGVQYNLESLEYLLPRIIWFTGHYFLFVSDNANILLLNQLLYYIRSYEDIYTYSTKFQHLNLTTML